MTNCYQQLATMRHKGHQHRLWLVNAVHALIFYHAFRIHVKVCTLICNWGCRLSLFESQFRPLSLNHRSLWRLSMRVWYICASLCCCYELYQPNPSKLCVYSQSTLKYISTTAATVNEIIIETKDVLTWGGHIGNRKATQAHSAINCMWWNPADFM